MDYIGTRIHFILERMLNEVMENRQLLDDDMQDEDEIIDTAFEEIREIINDGD